MDPARITQSFGRRWESVKLVVSQEAGVAQLVEQLIRNQQVIGSSPIAGSNLRSIDRCGASVGKPVFLGGGCHRDHAQSLDVPTICK